MSINGQEDPWPYFRNPMFKEDGLAEEVGHDFYNNTVKQSRDPSALIEGNDFFMTVAVKAKINPLVRFGSLPFRSPPVPLGPK